MHPNLMSEASKYAKIKQMLLSAYPELIEDEQTLYDTLDGESDLHQLIQTMVESVEDDENLVAAISERVAQLASRGKRLEARVEKKKQAILSVMMEAGIHRMTLPSATISQAVNPPAVVVVEAQLIPKDYWVEQKPPEPKLDKRGILRDLKEGLEVPGVTLSNQTTRLNWRSS